MLRLRRADKPRRQGTPRRTLDPPLIVRRVRAEDGSRAFFGYATNISGGGLFIGATNPREPGSRFQLEFPLPDPLSRPLCCECEVIWSRRSPADWTLPPGMGLRFVDLPPVDAEAIDHWVSHSSGPRG